MIQRLWNVTTTPKTLAKFYKENNIRYKTAKQVYNKAITDRDRLEAERREYSLLLGNVIQKSLPLIFIDESSFDNQAILPRSWAPYGQHQ